MNIRLRALKNIGAGWISLAVNMGVSIILTPLILHRLGDERYGIWVLVFSFAGYYSVFDFGLHSAVIRYVSRFYATKDYEQLTRYVNTILFLFIYSALLLLLLTGICSWYVPSIFRVSADLHGTVRLLFFIVGAMFALQLPAEVFVGILEGIQEFWLEYLVRIIAGLLRLVMIIVVLDRGLGLVSVSLVAVGLSLSSYAAFIFIASSRLRLRFVPKFSDFATLKEILKYSSTTFTSVVAGGLATTAGNIVIGVFLGATAITPFAIASKFVQYVNRFIQSSSSVFTPMSSHFDATGQMNRLRQVLNLGNRACAFVAFPALVGILFLGKPAIQVWVGAKYGWCYGLLVILAVPYTLQFAQLATPKILYGMARHLTLGKVRLLEAAASVVLSIVLLRHYGVWGVALGIAIPKFVSYVFFLPVYICRVLQESLGSFLRNAYMWPGLTCVPMVVALYLMHQSLRWHGLGALIIQTLIASLLYGVTFLAYALIKEPEGVKIRKRLFKFRSEALDQ